MGLKLGGDFSDCFVLPDVHHASRSISFLTAKPSFSST
jgi:hypothetical protein